MYWAVSRSKLRAWVQLTNSTNTTNITNTTNTTNTTSDGTFDSSRSGDADFDRGDPSWLAPFNTPVADNEDDPKLICLAGAAPDFYCLDAMTIAEKWKTTTGTLIKTGARFSTNGDRVYFIEEDGTIHSFNTDDGSSNWEQQVSNNVISNFDLSSDGGVLHCGDETGTVEAWQLSSSTPPPVTPATREPSAAPSMSPPSTPTAPTASRAPDSFPNPSPTNRPTFGLTSGASSMVVVSVLGVASILASLLLL